MAGWTNLTPSGGALAAGNAYLYEDTGALKYQGTSGSAATIVNADGTMASSGGSSSMGIAHYAGRLYPPNVISTGTTNNAQNRLFFLPIWIPADNTYTRIGTRVTTGGVTIRFGIYSNSSDNLPENLILDSGSVSSSSTGSVTAIISAALTTGLYWISAVAQGGVTGTRGSTGGSPYLSTLSTNIGANFVNGYYENSTVSGALPSSVSSFVEAASAPMVYIGFV